MAMQSITYTPKIRQIGKGLFRFYIQKLILKLTSLQINICGFNCITVFWAFFYGVFKKNIFTVEFSNLFKERIVEEFCLNRRFKN
jgi:hypothetical protein